MPFTSANNVISENKKSNFTSASDVIIKNNLPSVEKKPSITDKIKAFTGGVAEGLGADLPLMAIQKGGETIVNKFGTEQMKQNLARSKPLTEQFEDITHQKENPITAGAGNVAGVVGGLFTGATEAKALPVVKDALEAREAAKHTNFIKDLVTPTLSAKDTANAMKTGKVIEGGISKERDITGALPGFDRLKQAVSEVPNISPKKTLLENNNAIHDHIVTLANNLKSQIKDKGSFSPSEFKDYMNTVKTELQENPTLVGDAEKTANKILTKFESLVKEKGHTPSGLLEARKALDSWMSSQKGNVFNPNTDNAVSIALRSIRQGGNDFLASRVPDVAVKELLAKQSSLYNAIENIVPKAAKEGANGFQRWVKNHPKTIQALKYGAGITGVGVLGNALTP